MNRGDIIRMAQEAGIRAEHPSDFFSSSTETLERFAALVAIAERQKHQSDIERWKSEAATAEKWRGIACSKDGAGRTVQRIQEEAAAVEREACAQVCEQDWSTAAIRLTAAIRARGTP